MTARPATLDRCEICDDSGCDWTFVPEAGVYHKSCVQHRAANPNNEREHRGLANTLKYGRIWSPV